MFVCVALEAGTGAGLRLMFALSCFKNYYIFSIYQLYDIINIFLAGTPDSPHS